MKWLIWRSSNCVFKEASKANICLIVTVFALSCATYVYFPGYYFQSGWTLRDPNLKLLVFKSPRNTKFASAEGVLHKTNLQRRSKIKFFGSGHGAFWNSPDYEMKIRFIFAANDDKVMKVVASVHWR